MNYPQKSTVTQFIFTLTLSVVLVLSCVQDAFAGAVKSGSKLPHAAKSEPSDWGFLDQVPREAECDLKSRSGDIRGLLIGINDYKGVNIPSLSGSANDTELLLAAMKRLGAQESNLVVLKEHVSYRDILKHLENLVRTAGCGDTVFLHWSGYEVIRADSEYITGASGIPSSMNIPSSDFILLASDAKVVKGGIRKKLWVLGLTVSVLQLDSPEILVGLAITSPCSASL